ncbi:hypothetical protein QQF64_002035 [Cirrhinus molitorella]|uniref:Uncharacterized protein n=1 Tax=Cirrhinus molitorella TaxID=172907 RepID=A0ABR3MP10_9TELE
MNDASCLWGEEESSRLSSWDLGRGQKHSIPWRVPTETDMGRMSMRDKRNDGRERGRGAGVSKRLNAQYVHMMMVSSGF